MPRRSPPRLPPRSVDAHGGTSTSPRAQRDGNSNDTAEGATSSARESAARVRGALQPREQPGLRTLAALAAVELLSTGVAAPDELAARIVARIGCADATAREAMAEARDRIAWAQSADPDAVRAAWLASVDAIAAEAIRSRRLEAGLAALELRGRATGIVGAPGGTGATVVVNAGQAQGPEALEARLHRAHAMLAELRSAGLPARLLKGGGSQEGGGS